MPQALIVVSAFSKKPQQRIQRLFVVQVRQRTFRKWAWVVIYRIAELDYVSLSELIQFLSYTTIVLIFIITID